MERNWYTDYKVMPTMEEVEQGVRPAYSTQPAPQWKPQPSPADMRDRMNWRGKSLNFLQQYAPGSRTALSYVDPGLVNQFDKINAYSRQERQSDMGPIRRWVDDMKSGIEQTPGRLATMVATPPPAWPVLFAGEQAGEEAVNQGGWKNILKATDAEKMGAIGRTALSGVMGKLFSGASPTFSPNATSANLLKDALPAYARSVGSTIAKIAPVVAGQNALSAYEQGQLSDPQWMKDTALGLSTRTLPLIAGMQAVNYAKPLGQTYAVNKLMNERGLNRPAFAGPQWMPEQTAQPRALPNPDIYAWHGSPFRHNKFDINMIGKGEGIQAFGYGMPYLSQSEKVANWYKDMDKPKKLYHNDELLNNRLRKYASSTVLPQNFRDNFNYENSEGIVNEALDFIDYDAIENTINSHINDINTMNYNRGELSETDKKNMFLEMANKRMADYDNSYDDIVSTAGDYLPYPEQEEDRAIEYSVLANIYKNIIDDINAADALPYVPKTSPEYSPTLYKVKIPGGAKVHKFLKWDEAVDKNDIKTVIDKLKKETGGYPVSTGGDSEGQYEWNEILKDITSEEANINGDDLYNILESFYGSPEEASRLLYDTGYTGVDYPVGSLSGVGATSKDMKDKRNYVTFNPDDTEIVERYPKYPTQKQIDMMLWENLEIPSGPVIQLP